MPSKPRIDWNQLLYPGPPRPFTAAEMARAGSDGPSATLVATSLLNVAVLGLVVLLLAPRDQGPWLAAAVAGMATLGFGLARWLWWRPWRRPLMLASLGVAAAMVAVAAGIRWRVPDRDERFGLALAMGICGALLPALLWFLVIWRAQQIEGRLREQQERERAVEMARRLATAQVEPHFLFNTLASLQHWVQTKDDRAAPLLAALTGYLRATLPLFNRPLLPAADELLAVERYLQVMQARMGPRLAWQVDVPAPLAQALLPPGLLLTLVENAVVHGVEPLLQGGRITLRASLQGALVRFEVQDNGPGLGGEVQDGVGLANVRQRLALNGGEGARLSLAAAPGGGCLARIELPLKTENP